VNRLSTRLAGGYIVLAVVVFLGLGIFLTQEISERQNQHWERDLQESTLLLAQQIAPALQSGDDQLIQQHLEQFETAGTGSLAILDSSGTLIAGEVFRELDTLSVQSDIVSALEGQSATQQLQHPQLDDREMIAASAPALIDDAVQGVVVRTVPASHAPGTWTSITSLLVTSLLIGALIIVATALFIPRVITQPLADLTSTARRMARGDLDARANTDTHDELAELADALNDMTTAQRARLQAIEDERARLEAILEHLNDGILIVNPRGTISLMNQTAESLLGIDRDRALVRTYTEVVRDHELVGLIRNSHRLYAPDAPLPSQFIELGRPRRAVQAFAYPISQGETELVIVILRDITELRRTETVRRDFVTNVSHDLRTPIASLKALVDTLLAGALEDETVARDFLARMEVEVDDLARLVEELLELSRAESRRIELHQIPADADNLIRRVTARLQPHAEPKEITFAVDVPEDLPRGYFDPERIEQVLVNLTHNAVKFSPANSTVELTARQDSGEIEISVTDAGPGIPPDELDRVFERFYKTEKSRADTGSGLGLAIARHLVQLHGGQIWAESGPMGGATFTFTVPVAPEQTSAWLETQQTLHNDSTQD
jgi:two-component system, OmpR family, phosphate regulon sensor histidine kinase PhoR